LGTYGLRVPASRVGYVPDAQGGLPPGRHALYVRGTRTSLGRWVHTARHGTPGAQAYVRAALGLALGECASERGPTCIMGDARMARLYAEATAGAASDGPQRDVQGEPNEALPDGADDADVDLYPDL
jgi:hypothetical protein